MKKILIILFIACLGSDAKAQIPVVSVISTIVNKVIDALDLEIENLQNQTIWLQNAQKQLENAMAQIQLDGITDWVKQIKDLYSAYYQELSQVKSVIADYDKVKQIISLQSRIVATYNSAYTKFRQDSHFTQAEISYM